MTNYETNLPRTLIVLGKTYEVTWEVADDLSGWVATVETGREFEDDEAAEDFGLDAAPVDRVDLARYHADGTATLKINRPN